LRIAAPQGDFSFQAKTTYVSPSSNYHGGLLVEFDDDSELEIGLVYSFADASGGELPGLIVAFDEEEVTIDFNHPLAGRNILFDVLVHRVEPVELH